MHLGNANSIKEESLPTIVLAANFNICRLRVRPDIDRIMHVEAYSFSSQCLSKASRNAANMHSMSQYAIVYGPVHIIPMII